MIGVAHSRLIRYGRDEKAWRFTVIILAFLLVNAIWLNYASILLRSSAFIVGLKKDERRNCIAQ